MRKQKSLINIALFLLGLAVLIGAFGAHGLKNMVEEKYLQTFQTGVTYHFYHALGLLTLTLFDQPRHIFKKSPYLLLIGMLIFSFNCYLYALTQMKIFAMIVPFGGLLMVVGWFTALFEHMKTARQ